MSFKWFVIFSLFLHLAGWWWINNIEKIEESDVTKAQHIHSVGLPEKINTSAALKKTKPQQKTTTNKIFEIEKTDSANKSSVPVQEILDLQVSYPMVALRQKLTAEILVQLVIKQHQLASFEIMPHNFHAVFNQSTSEALKKASVKENIKDGVYQVKVHYLYR